MNYMNKQSLNKMELINEANTHVFRVWRLKGDKNTIWLIYRLKEKK